MSCNTCKSKSKESNKIPISDTTGRKNYFVKFIIFLLASAILIPFIIPILIVVLFRVIVLSHGVDITPLLKHIGKKIFTNKEDPDDDDEELDEEEYELENPDDVIVIKKH